MFALIEKKIGQICFCYFFFQWKLHHSQNELRLIETVTQHHIYAHLNVYTESWLFHFCAMVWIWPWCSHKEKKQNKQHCNTWPNLKQISHWFQPHGPRAKCSALLPVKSVAKVLLGAMWVGWLLCQACIRTLRKILALWLSMRFLPFAKEEDKDCICYISTTN